MIIPQDIEAERGAIACVLASNGQADSMMDLLDEADFNDLRHIDIFRAMISLQFDERPINTITLVQLLKESSSLDSAGGFDYVATIEDATPSSANFPLFVQTLKDRSQRRRMLSDSQELERKALDLATPVEAKESQSLESLLYTRQFNFNSKPKPTEPVFSLCNNVVCTAGNLTSIVSQAKTGKSAVVGAMLAATMVDTFSTCDLLGFASSNDSGKAVIHFDTEQAPDDHWHCVALAIRRSERSDSPLWLLSYCLTGLLPRDAWRAVKSVISKSSKRFTGVHSVLIDGVGDLVHDVNDAGECNDFVAELHGLAIANICPIIGVLHFNPDTAKARGHLGSQLERKSESNLRLDKEDDTTVLWSNKQRRAAISRDYGPRFRWSNEAGMHVTVESRQEARRGAAAEAEIPCRDDVFHERQSMRYNDLVKAIESTVKCSGRTAERKAQKWAKLAVIEKSVGGLWIPKD